MALLFGLGAIACSDRQPTTTPDGGEPTPPAGPLFATGALHACTVFGDGAVRCWGDNEKGQLGRPPLGDPLADYSVDLGAGQRAAGVYAGQYHTCAILGAGRVKCWGDNGFGQLGLGDMGTRGDGVTAMGDALPFVELGTGERAVALALGGTASCALLDGGRVKCWGDPYQGATGYGDVEPRGTQPGTMGDNLPVVDLGSRDGVPLKVKSLEAFEYHSFCAIVDDAPPGTSGLKCWGSNDYCELGIGSHDGGRGAEPGTLGDALPWIDIGTTDAGAARKAVAIAAGFQVMCALGDDGVVKCWGTNRSGELGIGATGAPHSCVAEEMGNAYLVPLPAKATAIGVRYEHACAVLETGETTCWGSNMSGELGVGDTTERPAPSAALAFPDGFAATRLSLGDFFSCALDAADRVKCWGSNQSGQLDAASGEDRLSPGPDLRLRGAPVDAVAAGADHTCAVLTGGAVKCWGRNDDGQLGVGDQVNRGDAPDQMGDALPAVELGQAAIAIAGGASHSCAVLADGTVRCWGAGTSGQLGQGSPTSSLIPAPPPALPAPATAVGAGDEHSCALLGDGQVWCWGGGARGQLGSGEALSSLTPKAVMRLPGKVTALAVGARHACARTNDGRLACWGANDSGQLGTGDTQDRAQAIVVALGARRAVAVAAGVDSTCVLLDDGAVTCWGGNDRGQLGVGDTQPRTQPPAMAVGLGSGRQGLAVAIGGAFSCALLDGQQVKCWGDNTADQLGAPLRGPAYGDQPNELGDFLAAAVQGGGRDVRAIATGRAHACVVLDTRDVRCWGDNTHGQLGAGDAASHSLFLNPTSVVDIGAGAPRP